MNVHEEIRLSLPAYAARKLDETARRHVETHLQECEDCSSVVSSLELLALSVSEAGEEMFAPHPEPLTLRAHALGRGETDDRVVAHLRVCATCSLEAAAYVRETVAGSPRPRWKQILAAAAMLVIGIGLGLALRAFLQPERIEYPAASGGGGILSLRSLRGSAPPNVFRVDPGDSFVTLALPLLTLDDRQDQDGIRYEIRRDPNEVIWTWDTNVARLRSLGASSEMAAFPIPTRDLTPAHYTLIVRGDALDPSKALLEIPFEIVAR